MDSLPDEVLLRIVMASIGCPVELDGDSGDCPTAKREATWHGVWHSTESAAQCVDRTGRSSLLSLRLVSRRMCRLASDASLWPTVLSCGSAGVPPRGLPHFVTANLRTIEMIEPGEATDLLVFVADRAPRLETLIWGTVMRTVRDFEAMAG